MRLPPTSLLFALLCAGLRAASFDDRVEALFRAPLGEWITLSPDGQRVAYAVRDGGQLKVVIMSVEPPGPKRVVKIDPDREAAGSGEAVATELRFMRWAPNGRLVFAPVERVVPLPPLVDKHGRAQPNPDGPTIVAPILAMDADGKQRGAVIDARDFQETPEAARRSLADFLRTPKEMAANRHEPVHWRMPHLDILGFHPRDRDQLIVATHGAYSMPMQHLVDLRTGSVREFGDNWPRPPGAPQVFDWYRLKTVGEQLPAPRPATAWRDDELGRVQRELETKFPRRIVELLDWSETRSRVLARVTGGRDAGRVFVYQRLEDVIVEILPLAPWLDRTKLHETQFFECNAADGARLSGYATWPARPPRSPPPVVVVFPSGFPSHAHPAFDPEAQVLAELGFAVVRLNHRAVAGVRHEDLHALRTALDRVAVEDARAVLDALAARHPAAPFDRQRVAALGRGFGGHLALRAVQLQPAAFRCAIAIDVPADLRAWLRGGGAVSVPAALLGLDGADARNVSVLEQAESLTRPALLLLERRRDPAIEGAMGALRARLEALGRAVEYAELESGFAAGRPGPRLAGYRRIEEFLNVHLHGYAVKVGAPKEVQ